jgi:serine/threonine protein phosphatase PrpC
VDPDSEANATRISQPHAAPAESAGLRRRELDCWKAAGDSVQGAAHKRQGLPNQDFVCFRPIALQGPPLMAAVADGHGSARSFRSDIGSKYAAFLATDTLLEFVTKWSQTDDLTAAKRAAEDHLPRALVRAWRHAVEEHLAGEAFTPEEEQRLKDREGRSNHTLAYGSTVVAVAVTATFILYLQLGDGDILVVAADEKVETVFRPEGDEKPVGEETVSLCSREAEQSFCVKFERLDPRDRMPPSLILLSTDGYSKSYAETSGFLQVGRDILRRIRDVGFETVEKEIKGWLDQVSSRGSGDDVTLALLYRVPAVPGGPSGLSAAVEPAGPEIHPSQPQDQEPHA